MSERAYSMRVISLVLGLVLVARSEVKTPPPTPSPAFESQAPVQKPLQKSADSPADPVTKTGAAGGKVFTWQEVESEDYSGYLSRLREAGCPPNQIERIAVSDVNELFANKRMELAVSRDHEWWRFETDPTLIQIFEEKRQTMAEERLALLKKLLSPAWKDTEEERAPVTVVVPLTGPILGRLPRKLHDTVQEYCARSMERYQSMFMDRQNDNQPVTQVDLAKLRNQTRVDLGQLLSPAELEEFLLRYSHNSMRLRNDLRGFEPGSEEFRKIFRVIDPIDHQMQLEYGGAEMLSPKQRDQLERQKDRAIQAALPPERFQAYLLYKDPFYRQAQMIAQQVGAPTAAVLPLSQLRKQSDSKRQQIASDATLTPEQKNEALKSAQQEQQVALKKILGDDVYQRYVQFGFNQN